MRYYLLLFIATATVHLYAQHTSLHYRDCNGCPVASNSNPTVATALYTYGPNIPYQTGHIESDFDLRRAGGDSRWHKGIDLRNHGAGDHQINQRGDAIINPDSSGVITQLDHLGYKWIAIDGQHLDFGYGHIFSHNDISNTSTWRNGNLLLKMTEPDNSDEVYPCIVNLNTCVAYSRDSNLVVILPNNPHCNDTLYTTNRVAYGEAFAPVGGSRSSTTREFPVHIHLYKLRDPAGAANYLNCMDPMVDLAHPVTHYELGLTCNLDIEDTNFNQWNHNALIYPGTRDNTLALRATMTNANRGVDASRYTNVVHNLDSIELLMRNVAEQTAYEPIEGPNFRTQFLLSAKRTTPLYPRRLRLATTPYGTLGRTGISPRAYQDGAGFRPYDNYYFADFVSRLHKDDPQNGSTNGVMHAYHNDDAMYPDGSYELKARVTTVRDEVHEGPVNGQGQLDPVDLVIDNYKPYINRVMVRRDVGGSHPFIYDAEINASAPSANQTHARLTLQRAQIPLDNMQFQEEFQVWAYSSEPLQNLDLEILSACVGCYVSVYISVPYLTIFNIGGQFDPNEDIQFRFRGQDMAGNELLNLAPTLGSNTGQIQVSLPWRNGTGNNWSTNQPAGSYEDLHRLRISPCPSNNFGGPGTRMNRVCHWLGQTEYEVQSANLGMSDGAISLRLHREVDHPVEFTWYDENSNVISRDQDLLNVPPGEYCVTMVDANCCEVRKCISLSECNELRVAAFVTRSCQGMDNGKLNISEVSPFSFDFRTISYELNGELIDRPIPPSGLLIENIPAGEFCYQITDPNNGCTQEFCEMIPEIAELEVNIEPLVEAACRQGSFSGSIKLIVDSDDPNLTFEWIDRPNSAQHMNLEGVLLTDIPAGSYMVEVSNGGCDRDSLSIYVPHYRLSVHLDHIKHASWCRRDRNCPPVLGCTPDGELRVSALGGTPPYTFEWYAGHTTEGPRIGSGSSLSGLEPGRYTVVVTDAEGCDNQYEEYGTAFSVFACEEYERVSPTREECAWVGANLPELELTVEHLSSTSECSGSIHTNYNMWLPHTASWTGPGGFTSEETEGINGLCEPGEYCVSLFNGCSEQTACVELVDCSESESDLNITTSPACTGYNNGTALISVHRPVGDYRVEIIDANDPDSPNIGGWTNLGYIQQRGVYGPGDYIAVLLDRGPCTPKYIPFTIGEEEPVIYSSNHFCGQVVKCLGNTIDEIHEGEIREVPDPDDCRLIHRYCGDRQISSRQTDYQEHLVVEEGRCFLELRCENSERAEEVITGGNLMYREADCSTYYYCSFPEYGERQFGEPLSNDFVFDHVDKSSCELVFKCNDQEERVSGDLEQYLFLDIDNESVIDGQYIYACYATICNFASEGYPQHSYVSSSFNGLTVYEGGEGLHDSTMCLYNIYASPDGCCCDEDCPDLLHLWFDWLPCDQGVQKGDCGDISLNDYLWDGQMLPRLSSTGITLKNKGVPIDFLYSGMENGVTVYKSRRLFSYIKNSKSSELPIASVSAYPNPFTSDLTLSIESLNNDIVQIDVFSTDGRRVRTFMNQAISTGRNELSLPLGDLSTNGLHIIRVTSAHQVFNQVSVIKM